MGFGKICKKKKIHQTIFNGRFKVKPDITFSIFLKMQQKQNNYDIKRFIYLMLTGIHINIVEKCYQWAINEQISLKSDILSNVNCMKIAYQTYPLFC